ncbi:thioredoxin domain-containing protein [Nannocystis sp.]|uniref:DsbA family protein n=1 Tax=Nannocystis sp. TaxID=1962667 RepID=UPI0025F8ECB4|nr:thioredoxin domain-containing protein [Nannocystis sp.]MBK7829816.1 thioredoxin domain-containing protein [Nannocystis sp.]
MRSTILASSLFGLTLTGCAATPSEPHADAHGDPQTPTAPPVSERRHKVPLGPDDHPQGGALPLVTVVVYSDYACPPCARTSKVLEHLLEDYGDDLRVVFRSLTVPGFADGERAAEAALAAGAQGQFWAMHRRLFSEPRFDRVTLKAHAEALGLDVPRFLDDLELGAFSALRAQHRRQAISLGIYFGPVALVNGRPVIGYRDEAAWHELLDEEILAARTRMQAGTPRADLYATFQADAGTGPIDLDDEQAEMRRQLAERFPVDINELPADFVRAEAGRRYPVDLLGAPSIGPADAPVTLVVFVDFACPHCRRAAEALRLLPARYPNDLRVVFRHLPLPAHRSAEGAARAAIAAEAQGQFWPFCQRLLTLERPSLGRDTFLAIARDLGLDEARFLADLDGPGAAARVREDMLHARRLGLDSTPAFFLNGRYISGYRDIDALAADIDVELSITKKLQAEGIPRAELITTLLAREGSPLPNPEASN